MARSEGGNCMGHRHRDPTFQGQSRLSMLLIELPASMRTDVPNLACGSFKLTSLKNCTWASARAGLALNSEHNAIEFVASELLALLRLSNQGCILVLFVCGNDVTIVEYGFYREQFLEVCFEVYLDWDDALKYRNNRIDLGGHIHYIHQGRDCWLPEIVCIAVEERIYL